MSLLSAFVVIVIVYVLFWYACRLSLEKIQNPVLKNA